MTLEIRRHLDGRPVRALSLLSGGLDSMLAVCVLKAQGIEVQGLTFESPFFSAHASRVAAAALQISHQVVDFTGTIVGLLRHPPHGFGSCMNPCIDCHASMFREAGEKMRTEGFDFLSTGEVLNERPMSQTRRSLDIVEKDSNLGGFLLRPLSAKHLPETEPERRGWVDRTRLLALQGRQRTPQFALAKAYGLDKFPWPGGGCKLTDPMFSKRLADLRDHEGYDAVQDLQLLKYGRHFKLGPSKSRLIVGRNAADNDAILTCVRPGDRVYQVLNAMGPIALLPARAPVDVPMEAEAASICASYSDAPTDKPARVQITQDGVERWIEIMPMPRADVEKLKRI